jgi:hypothetical protein
VVGWAVIVGENEGLLEGEGGTSSTSVVLRLGEHPADG